MAFLACVQSKLELDAYRSSDDFAAWILEQTHSALEARDPSEAALVAFPELIGLPLAFFLDRPSGSGSQVFSAQHVSAQHLSAQHVSAQQAALGLLRESWFEAISLGLRHGRLLPANLLLPGALEVFATFELAFSRAARETNAFIVAGSAFLPGIESEAARGVFLSDARVQNLSMMFAPSGRIVSRQAKIHLTKGLESMLGLATARPEDLLVTRTPVAAVATLICFDAFFERDLERADALGAQILVQPSANAARWDGPWSADSSLVEGVEWWRRGPASSIQGRVNVRACLNPMLVGKLFELEFEGRSSIAVNRGLVPERVGPERVGPEFVGLPHENLIAVATSSDQFEVVHARL
jgi:predicted amidohydrolase